MFLDALGSLANPGADIGNAIPLMVLLFVGLVLMLLDAFDAKPALPYVTGGGFLLAGLLAYTDKTIEYAPYFNGMIYLGGISSMIQLFLCIGGFFSLFFIEDYMQRHKKDLGETYSLIVFATIGMILLAIGNDLIITFVGLEIMSVCLYIMAGIFPRNVRSNEAGLKYFLLGAFATGFFLYGIALIYGLSGMDPKGPSTRIDVLVTIIPGILNNPTVQPMYYAGLGLLLIGAFFKIAAFPFHSWTPDVYTGAPTPLAGFMATGGKMAAFIGLVIMADKLDPNIDGKFITFLSIIAVISMIYGNIVAAQQTNIKRILAYSSIAHTGCLILGISGDKEGHLAIILYMLIYTIMTIGAFGVISMVENEDGDTEISRWKGLGLRQPIVGIAMSTFLFSLAGMPPLAGFIGKYFVFTAAIKAGLIIPCIIGILTSVIGAYYYLRIIVVMYFQKPEEEAPILTIKTVPIIPLIGVIALLVLLIFVGVFPGSIQNTIDAVYSGSGLMSGK